MEAQSARAGGPYQVLVVPLLIESGLDARVDRVLVVDCSESVQHDSPHGPGRGNRGGVERLLAAQLDRADPPRGADDVLVNAGTRDELRERVRALHNCYLRFAADPRPQASRRGRAKGGVKAPRTSRPEPLHPAFALPVEGGAEYRENKDSGSKPDIHG